MTFSAGFGGGGAFGGGSSPGAFGKPAGAFGAAPASPFGAPVASPSAFGASTTSSPFGTSTQPNAFNAPGASPSPFGGTNTSIRPQGSVFGGNGTIGGPGASQARTFTPWRPLSASRDFLRRPRLQNPKFRILDLSSPLVEPARQD